MLIGERQRERQIPGARSTKVFLRSIRIIASIQRRSEDDSTASQCSADGPQRKQRRSRDLGLLFSPIEGSFCFGPSAAGLDQLFCSCYSPLHRVVSPCYWDGRYSFSSAAAAQRIRSSCGLPPASFSFPLRSGRYDERPQSRYETNLLSPLKLNYNPLSIHIHTLLGSLVLVVGILLKIQTCVCFHNSFLPFPQCSNAKIYFTFLRKFPVTPIPKQKQERHHICNYAFIAFLNSAKLISPSMSEFGCKVQS